MIDSQEPPRSVIEAYDLEPQRLERLESGHINVSFFAQRRDGRACVLQRVNPIFPPAVNEDIDAVTRHLAGHGITTPRLLPTSDGNRYLETDGEVWRLLTRIGGRTHLILENEAMAFEAGRILGVFHRNLSDFDQPLAHTRAGVHDLRRHLAALDEALERHRGHAAHASVSALAGELARLANPSAAMSGQPDRLVHGDPKISNVMFDGSRAVCLIDLDTISRAPVAVELGDALRSWCNPEAEDSAAPSFSLERCEAALAGYRHGAPALLSPDEWQRVPDATLGIAIELAARFAADALNESYFAWDATRFGSASEHNRARARAQLALARDIQRQLTGVREVVMTVA